MAAIVGQWIEGTNAIVRQLMYCTYAIGRQAHGPLCLQSGALAVCWGARGYKLTWAVLLAKEVASSSTPGIKSSLVILV